MCFGRGEPFAEIVPAEALSQWRFCLLLALQVQHVPMHHVCDRVASEADRACSLTAKRHDGDPDMCALDGIYLMTCHASCRVYMLKYINIHMVQLP